ncbi:hypothetical protein HPULCUR_002564 [Helicostylum pulchrum]|uniref:Uncharacterized protein n=1 Tax=Helicostylum pulchrum TaxID=562976 RepID=A0ABP9XS56_9FUNG
MAHNLGTVQRRLITLIEEFKRARDSWEEINSHAFPLANTLTNSVIQSRYVDESQYWHPLLTMEFPNLIQQFDRKMQILVEKQNESLCDLVEKMNQLRELCTLYDRTKATNEQVDMQPIFKTCSLNNYIQRMNILVKMYAMELETKRSLVSNGIKNILTREEGVVILSIWINQPSLVKSSLQEWVDICTTEMELSS